MLETTVCYKRHRFPPAIIAHAIWLYLRFSLSLRAVEEQGIVLEELLQPRRDKKAAKRLLRRLLKSTGRAPKRIVTDRLRSYAAAKREVVPGLEHRAHKGLNNRAENSHLPFRSREKVMRGHRSPGGLQRFASMHSAVRNRFVPSARRRSAQATRYHRLEAIGIWREAAGLAG